LKIILDGMGGDNSPSEIVKGAVHAARDFNFPIRIVGKQDVIEAELKKYGDFKTLPIDILHANEVIEMDESP